MLKNCCCFEASVESSSCGKCQSRTSCAFIASRSVDVFTTGSVEHVCCATCGREATLDKAVDDCFIFVVAGAATGLQQQGMRAVVDYMPRQADDRQNHLVKADASSYLRLRQRTAA